MAGRQPGGLDVRHVVQVKARHGERLQVIDGRDLLLHKAPQRSVLALEKPGDERSKSSGLFLELPEAREMVHAMLQGLTAAEHHGGGSAEAETVSGAVHVEPFFRVALQPSDAEADLVVQYLRARPGDRIQAGVSQARDRVADRQPADLRDVQDFRR